MVHYQYYRDIGFSIIAQPYVVHAHLLAHHPHMQNSWILLEEIRTREKPKVLITYPYFVYKHFKNLLKYSAYLFSKVYGL